MLVQGDNVVATARRPQRLDDIVSNYGDRVRAVANDRRRLRCGRREKRSVRRGAEWEQRECPNRLVWRPSEPNRHQAPPLSCDASYLARSSAWPDGHRHPPFGKFSSAIHDVRYRLSWCFLLEAIETGERPLIPYRLEQIGSKQLTSSQMQRRSAHSAVPRIFAELPRNAAEDSVAG